MGMSDVVSNLTLNDSNVYNEFDVEKQVIDNIFVYYNGNAYVQLWRNSYTVYEHRGIYDSNMKFFRRLKKPKSIEFNELIEWFKENMAGSWKVVIDVAVRANNECEFLYNQFSLLVSREEDLIHYTLAWM